MEQQSSAPQSNSNLSLVPTQTSFQIPKPIKPLILTNSKITQFDPQKSMKLYSKASRQAKHTVNQKDKAFERSKAFTKLLSAQSKFSNLQYFLNFSKHFENILLFSHLKNLSSVSSLYTSLANKARASTRSVKTLLKNLPNLKNLTTLEIRLLHWALQDSKILHKFIKSIRKIRSIINLSFIICSCSDLSQVHFNSFFHHLSKLTHLQTLKLNFDQSINSETPNILHSLASTLPKLTFLTQLDISLDGLKGILISKVSQFLQSLHFLKNLTLNFKSFEIIPELNKQLPTMFPHLTLPSLQKLRLHLPCNINDKCLETLSEVLTSLTSLSTLNLSMIQCTNITNQGIDYLQFALSRMLTLSSLSLHLPFLAKTPLVISKIASALKYLQNLIKLDLLVKIDFVDLSIPGPTSNETQELFTNLRFLKSLQYLDLHLPTRNELEDYAFETLAESLKELVSLKNFFFNPGFVQTLTNKGVEAFSDAIKSLKNLSGLTVFFRLNKEINEKAVDFLGNALLNHPALSSVKLNFMECPHVKKLKSFGKLFEAIKQMKDTNDIVVHIPYSENDGPEGKYLKGKNILKTFWLA